MEIKSGGSWKLGDIVDTADKKEDHVINAFLGLLRQVRFGLASP